MFRCHKKEQTKQNKQTNKQNKTKQTNKQTHKQSAHDGDGICWERLAIRNLPTFLDPQGPLGPNLRKGTFYMGTSHKMGKKKQFLNVFNGVKPKNLPTNGRKSTRLWYWGS